MRRVVESLSILGAVGFLAAAGVMAWGCQNSDCEAGRQASCACPAGQPNGTQLCGSNGTYGSCQCGTGGQGGGTTTTTTSSTTTTTTSSTTTTTTTTSSGGGGAGGSSCDAPKELCDGTCTAVLTSNDHCGTCDNACPAVATCQTGKCKCPNNQQLLCGEACENALTDNTNCGGCGHDCRGATCANGVCAPTTIASTQTEPYSVGVYSGFAYWTTAGVQQGIYRAPADGTGSAAAVVTGQFQPRELAIADPTLYWANFGLSGNTAQIQEYPLPNGPITAPPFVPSLATGVWGIAVHNGYVYWTNQNEYSVKRAPVTSPHTPQTLTINESLPWDIAVDDAYAYWSNYDGGQIKRVPVGGGGVTVLTSAADHPVGVAINATHVYWASEAGGEIRRVPIAGGQVEVIATEQSSPTYVALDDTFVYWTNYGNGEVAKAPIAGGDRVVLAKAQNQPYYIALDDQYAYWTTMAGGTIMRVAK